MKKLDTKTIAWIDMLTADEKAMLGSLIQSAMGAMHLSFAAGTAKEQNKWDAQQWRWMKFAKKLQATKDTKAIGRA
jgi:hypothetical protein